MSEPIKGTHPTHVILDEIQDVPDRDSPSLHEGDQRMSTPEERVASDLWNGRMPDPVGFVTEMKAMIYGEGFKDGTFAVINRLREQRDAYQLAANMARTINRTEMPAVADIMVLTVEQLIDLLEGKKPVERPQSDFLDRVMDQVNAVNLDGGDDDAA